ncbi:MAG: RNA polymerase sigma factor [Muribaculaceae bacterium]|nr:RNA polymerase sigma factor [Muribaculaceae bacterium]
MTANEFKKRYLAYHKRLYRLAYVMTSDPQDAEDLLQDLYMKMWQVRDTLPRIGNPEAFMATVMRRIYCDRARKGDISADALPLSAVAEIPSAIEADTLAERRDDREALEQFIAQLPPKEQTVIRMCVLEDKDYNEIGEITGLAQGSIRVLVMRAKNKIKEKFIKRSKI